MENEILKTKKTDILSVDPRNIVIKEGFNVRQDMGDLEALMYSLVESGQQVPIKCAKVRGEEKYELIEGHRRIMAINMALERGLEFPYVKVEMFSGSDEDRLFTMLITGTGQKQLTELEQAEGFKRLINFGYKKDDIAKKVGLSPAQVYNMIQLANVPQKIKIRIAENKISGNTVIQLIREVKDSEEQIKIVEDAIANVESTTEEGKNPKKVTAKNISVIKTKTTEQKLKELVQALDESGIKNDKTELLVDLVLSLKDSSVEELKRLFVS
jgi:ParB family chromosome partitioning protein